MATTGSASKTQPRRLRAPRGTDGRQLGRRGQETREALLEQLLKQLRCQSWHELSILEVARGVGRSPATFYQYFTGVNEALSALCKHLTDQGRAFPPQLERIVYLRNGEPGRRAKLPDPIADRQAELAQRVADLEEQLAAALGRPRSRGESPRTKPSLAASALAA